MASEIRLEILKGNDSGAQFRITGPRVLFGRSQDCDVIITDPSASRNHAELVFVDVGYVIRDLKSSNGIFVNGRKVNEQVLVSGDVFSIGDHAYRYTVVEKQSLPQQQLRTQSVRQGTIPGISSSSRSSDIPAFAGSSGTKKRIIIYGSLGLLILIFIILGASEDDTKKEKKAKTDISQEIPEEEQSFYDKFINEQVSYDRKIDPGMEELFNKANSLYFSGRRELRVKNYIRALEEFRKALTFYPKHGLSRHYIKVTLERIKEESNRHLKIGKRYVAQFRYDLAIKSFKEVMGLNSVKPDSRIYKEAEKMLKIAEKRDEEQKRKGF